ncbi:MAG: hypothetical protein IJT98_05915 [Prevotella sp.]|nr:hypothetical protein [Prevotella sp.]
MKEPRTIKLRQRHIAMRWCCAVLLLLAAATTQAALNISLADRQILAKAGINVNDFGEWRFPTNDDGHITRVYLYDCGLTTLPLALLELPCVEVVELYNNAITGNLGTLVQAYISTNPVISPNLTTLNINDNQLTGDIGPLVSIVDVPSMQLYALRNHISDISILPTNEGFWLDLWGQTIDVQIDFNADTQTPDELMSLLPRVCLFDPYSLSLKDYENIECRQGDEHKMTIYPSSGGFSVWTRDDLRFQSGDVFKAACGGNYFDLRVFFTKGDANFSGTIDEDDLNAMRDYMEDNNAWSFNFTAGDLNNDGFVDVLDYVALMHIVEGTTPQTTTPQGDNILIMGDLQLNSQEKFLPVVINNADDLVALQFDMKLPYGVWPSLGWSQFTDRVSGDYDYRYDEINYADGIHTFRIMLWSTTGSTLIAKGQGEVFTLKFYRETNLSVSTFPFQAEHVVFATTDSRNVFTSAQLGTLDLNMQADDLEWNILQQASLTCLNNDGDEVPFWDFSGGPETAKNLRGVTIEDGHITRLELQNDKLTGQFPFVLTTLPYLKELFIYNNQLSGDLGEQAQAFAETSPTVSAQLAKIDMDRNNFHGNIGPFIALYPTLQTLYAQYNRLSDISPLPDHQFSINLGGQQLDSITITVNTATMTTAEFLSQLPDLVRYNTYSNALSNDIHIYCYRTGPRVNVLDVRANDNGTWSFWTDGSFYKQGETFVAEGGNGIYNLRLLFSSGDADFNGQIDVADVQRLAYCIGRNEYRGWGLVNASASDLNGDSLLNVLDVVLLVNQVLALQPAAVPAYIEQPDVWLSCTDGQLVVNSREPVAAFDIMLSSNEAITLSDELQTTGMTVSTEQRGDKVHLVAWSMTGQTLPAGQTVIGQLANNARITGAVLVDESARRMAVMANPVTNGISTMQADPQKAAYELRTGHGHSISIEQDGKKTLNTNNTK